MPEGGAAGSAPSGRSASRASVTRDAACASGSPRPPARRSSPWRRRRASCRSWRTRRGAPTSPDPRPATTSRGTCCGCPGPPRASPSRRRGCRGGGAGGTDAGPSACAGRARPAVARPRAQPAAFCGAHVTGQRDLRGASGARRRWRRRPSARRSAGHRLVGADREHRRGGVEDLGEAAARPPAWRRAHRRAATRRSGGPATRRGPGCAVPPRHRRRSGRRPVVRDDGRRGGTSPGWRRPAA